MRLCTLRTWHAAATEQIWGVAEQHGRSSEILLSFLFLFFSYFLVRCRFLFLACISADFFWGTVEMQFMKALKLLYGCKILFTTPVVSDWPAYSGTLLLCCRYCAECWGYTVDDHRHSLCFQGLFRRKTHAYMISPCPPFKKREY